jgi:AraC-like DNA-binding protein
VRLWPDAVTPVLGIPARDLRDYVGPAPPGIASLFAGLPATLLASDDGDAVFAAADLWLSELLRDAPPPDPAVRAAVRAVVAGRGAMAAPDVARAAGIGLRQLQRRFRAATGLTLRDWSRVRRLREALALKLGAQPGGWSRIAAETGFVDQAHLNREFVALTGLVPSAAARMLANTEHERVTP